MLDLTTTRGKIIDAALRLAAIEGWGRLSLDQIANAAGVGLVELSREFSPKADILAAYTRAVDDAVLAKVTAADATTPARDRLFDVLMNRFELMAPHKPGLRRIAADLRAGDSLAQLGVAARSIYWMLAAAGIDAEGGRGVLRVPVVMGIYARSFDTWLEENDPGLARTMATLDNRLRRAERVAQRIDDIGAAASRVFANLRSAVAGAGRRPRSPADEMPPPGANDSRPPQPPQPNSGEPGPAPAL